MNAALYATSRSSATANSVVRLVVFQDHATDAHVLRFLSALPAVAEMELHVVVAKGRRNEDKLEVRVLRQNRDGTSSSGRWIESRSYPAQQQLSNCGPDGIQARLARYCARIDASLAIIAMDSVDRASPWQSISLAEQLARHLPVLAIPASGTAASFSASRPVRWLVPLDGSPSAEAILAPLRTATNWLASDVTLVQPLDYARLWQTRVVRNRPVSIARLGPSIADSRDYLSRIARDGFGDSATRFGCVTGRATERSIVRLANSPAIDAVAIGLSDRWRIIRLLTAELNEQLRRRVRKPMLLFQPNTH